jgi:uncharacterized protein YegP (UPF0339 family)
MPARGRSLSAKRVWEGLKAGGRALTAVARSPTLPGSQRNATHRGAMMAYKFELFTDKAGETRFRFKASNGEIMFSSEGYKQKKSAQDAIASIQKNVAAAAVDDQTGK